MKHVTLVALAAINVLVLTPVHAQDSPSTRVAYSDLDLSSTAGQSALYHRVKAAAVKVCGGWEGPEKYMVKLPESGKCTRQAIERAVADINVPGFSAFVAGKAGITKDILLAAK